jgi:hypothetical protein
MTRPLPAEYIGKGYAKNGKLNIGDLEVDYVGDGYDLDAYAALGWQPVHVYVRRSTATLAVIEIAIGQTDRLPQETLDNQNAEAQRYPLGIREYWRGQMVGESTYGNDQHLMTDADFEQYWQDEQDQADPNDPNEFGSVMVFEPNEDDEDDEEPDGTNDIEFMLRFIANLPISDHRESE